MKIGQLLAEICAKRENLTRECQEKQGVPLLLGEVRLLENLRYICPIVQVVGNYFQIDKSKILCWNKRL